MTVTDAKSGLEAIKKQISPETVDTQTYWSYQPKPIPKNEQPSAHLLPVYDEYTVAYKDRSAVLEPAHTVQAGNGIFKPIIIIHGKVLGTWTRTLKKDTVVIKPVLFTKLNKKEQEALAIAANRYGKFLNLPVSLS